MGSCTEVWTCTTGSVDRSAGDAVASVAHSHTTRVPGRSARADLQVPPPWSFKPCTESAEGQDQGSGIAGALMHEGMSHAR